MPCLRSDPRRCPEPVEGGVTCRFASDIKREAPAKEEGAEGRKEIPFHAKVCADGNRPNPGSDLEFCLWENSRS